MSVYLGSNKVNYTKLIEEKPKQSKNVQYNGYTQIILPDFGYQLNKVTVTPMDPSLENINTMKEIDLQEINNDGGYVLASDWEYAEAEVEFQPLAHVIMYGETIEPEVISDYYLEENIAYVKQMDLFDSVFGIRKISESDYTIEEIQRLEKILINLTQGA